MLFISVVELKEREKGHSVILTVVLSECQQRLTELEVCRKIMSLIRKVGNGEWAQNGRDFSSLENVCQRH